MAAAAGDDDDIHQRPMSTDVDGDLGEEMHDFRLLDSLLFDRSNAPKIPKRGEKDYEPHSTALQAATLEASRAAMHNALSTARIHPPKSHATALYDAAANMACVHARGPHFQTVGKHVRGKEWLLPEEALFMVERGSLDVRWPVAACEDTGNEAAASTPRLGSPMSLQGAYAAFIGMETGVGGKLTLEMYTVYAALKRAGYIVFRTGSWDAGKDTQKPPAQYPRTKSLPSGHWVPELFAKIRGSMPGHSPFSCAHQHSRLRPLAAPGLYRSYRDIFRLLQLIPTHDREAHPTFALPQDASNPFRISFDVYKPASNFRKSARGAPDFQIGVVNARNLDFPTLSHLNDLLASVPFDKPGSRDSLYLRLKHGSRHIVLAVVDQGIPSYFRVADVPFVTERLYQNHKAPKGKGGRGRSKGRSRGG